MSENDVVGKGEIPRGCSAMTLSGDGRSLHALNAGKHNSNKCLE